MSKIQAAIGIALVMLTVAALCYGQVTPEAKPKAKPRVAFMTGPDADGRATLVPALRDKAEFKVGDTVLFIRRGTSEIVGKGKVHSIMQTDDGKRWAVCEITDVFKGPRPEDEAYVANRSDSPYSIANIALGRREP